MDHTICTPSAAESSHPNATRKQSGKTPTPHLESPTPSLETLQAEITALKQTLETQKQALDALHPQIDRQTQEINLLENIIALMPGHVYWVGADGRYRGCNDQHAESSGLTRRQDIVGKLHEELPWNYRADKAPENLDRMNAMVMSLQETVTQEEHTILPDGTHKTFLSTKYPLFNKDNQIIGMVGISVDVSKRKNSTKTFALALQESAAAHHAQTNFLKTLTQDIREPIDGMLHAARELGALKLVNPTEKSMVHYLSEQLAQSTEELLRLFDALLESAQIAAKHIPVKHEKFDVRALVNSVMTLTETTAQIKAVSILPKIDNTLPTLLGDPFRLHRIILELVIQALKVSNQGVITIHATTCLRADASLGLKISVEDQGPDVPEASQPLLFTGLYTRQPIPLSTQPKRQGLELGLLIIKQLVEELQGEIYYESRNPSALRSTTMVYKSPETPIDHPNPIPHPTPNATSNAHPNKTSNMAFEIPPGTRYRQLFPTDPENGGRLVCIVPISLVASVLEPKPAHARKPLQAKNDDDKPTQMFNSTYWALARRLNGEPILE